MQRLFHADVTRSNPVLLNRLRVTHVDMYQTQFLHIFPNIEDKET